ncbi:hypothetical protein PYW08_005333 [Mythimna loreyi]|uniref:Uncharacterized protein n=1 Tax=Mythimna loreyi TaxID=667449 RepID=A0ACC2QI81_9NEOP|nr:hypothetical protein PYW08_005333 [Mythimna loreyi]
MEDVKESVIKALSVNLGKMLIECQAELEFSQDVVKDMLDFWNENNNLTSRDLGCALVCVFEKNEFLSPDFGHVQDKKAFEFFEKAGADEIMAGQLVDLFILCKRQTSSIENFCTSALYLAKCFRYGIFTMHWNPERFYWKHSQLHKSEHISRTGAFTKLFKSCPN